MHSLASFWLTTIAALMIAGDSSTAESEKKVDSASASPAKPVERSYFVAVGYGLRRLISTDGITWENDIEETEEAKTRDKDFLLRGVTGGKGMIVAVGGSKTSRILVSTDGKTWSEHSVMQNWLGDVAFGNDLFVAIGYQRAIFSRDGKEWSKPVTLRDASWRRIQFGNGRFVALGADGSSDSADGYVTTTTDAVKWNTTKLADKKIPHDIAFGNGRFVIVGSHGLRETSKDGTTWEHRTLGDKDEALSNIVWTGSEFLAAGNKGAYTSADGIEWARGKQKMPSRYCFGNGVFVGCSTGRFTYSKDGKEWKPAKTEGKLQITKIIHISTP